MERELTIARARSTDPSTSHEAAASIDPDELRESQRAVLAVLVLFGPMTDDELAAHYDDVARGMQLPQQSGSGLRTRRAELVRRARVRDSGQRAIKPSGRSAIRWEAVRWRQ